MATPRKRFASYPREVKALFPVMGASNDFTRTSLPSLEKARWAQRVFNSARDSAIYDREHSYREVKHFLATCSLILNTTLYVFSSAEQRKQFRQEYLKNVSNK